MQILGISGSLRAASSNTRLIEAAALCAPTGMDVVIYRGLGQLPLFNPDLDRDPLPAPVAELRQAVGASDALLICSPEYARGVSGAMKNALDWLVGSFEFPGKPLALMNASPRASDADAHLRLTLRTMSAELVDTACIAVPLLGGNRGTQDIVDNAQWRDQIVTALVALRDVIQGTRSSPAAR